MDLAATACTRFCSRNGDVGRPQADLGSRVPVADKTYGFNHIACWAHRLLLLAGLAYASAEFVTSHTGKRRRLSYTAEYMASPNLVETTLSHRQSYSARQSTTRNICYRSLHGEASYESRDYNLQHGTIPT